MPEQLYYGLEKIAVRLGVGKPLARRLCRDGILIAHKSKLSGTKGIWFCTESEIVESLRTRIPERL